MGRTSCHACKKLMNQTRPRLSTVVTYLEMTAPPINPTLPRPALPIALLRTPNIPVSFYRYLYETVGEDWLWYERRRIDDETLCTLIHDKAVEVRSSDIMKSTLYFCDAAETKFTKTASVRIKSVLMPNFISRISSGSSLI